MITTVQNEKPDYYRPDIDGLRTVAILPVLVYHYFPGWLPGGFVGVDIFFVISGYLITGIIVRQLELKHFSLWDFYLRRIKRIFPALSLVLSFCLVVGLCVFFPEEFQALGKYIVGGAGFVKNFVLWNESGYFDAAAIKKPLLHLWSLAIEEQFYLFWPLLLQFIIVRQLPLAKWILFIFTASFCVNLHYVFGGNITAAFYSPVSRVWELMVGAGLAIIHHKQYSSLCRFRSIQSCFGLVMVIGSMIFIRHEKFPGVLALIPVFGAALLINAGPNAIFNRTILSWPPVVKIGLISYPLYLWHWILLSLFSVVFGQRAEFSGFNYFDIRIILIASSIILSWLTYCYFEQPIRRSKSLRPIKVLTLYIIFLGVLGLTIYLKSGLPDRIGTFYNKNAMGYLKSSEMSPLGYNCFALGAIAWQLPSSRWNCQLGHPDGQGYIMVYGDSHSQSLLDSWDLYGKETGTRIIYTGYGNSLMLMGIESTGDRHSEKAKEVVDKILLHVSTDKPIGIVMIHAWSHRLHDSVRMGTEATGSEALRLALHRTLSTYEKLEIPVVILEDTPHQINLLSKSALRFNFNGDLDLNARAFKILCQHYNWMLASNLPLKYIDN